MIVIFSLFTPQIANSDIIIIFPYDIYSVFPDSQPVIDGVADNSEWNHVAAFDIGVGYIRVQNDASYLYILIDVTGDTVNDQPSPGGPDVLPVLGDMFSLELDIDRDLTRSMEDLIYTVLPGTFTLGIGNVVGGTTLSSTYKSRLGVGFGSSPSSATPHRFWEVAISMSEIDVQPNELVRLGVGIYSDNPSILANFPSDMDTTYTNLVEVALANKVLDLLVLGDESFLEALAPLKEHKDNTGIITYVQSWQSLNYSMPGYDEPERLKWGIHLYRLYCDIKYVMLVGDCDKLPVRYVKGYNSGSGINYLPSDLYYADLYDESYNFDDWDYDNDHEYGEFDYAGGTDINAVNLDKIDMHPNIMVGRIPASTVQEVETYVDKVINYELSGTDSSWFKNALYIVDGGAGAFGDETKKNQIDTYLTGFTITKAYQDNSPWNGMEVEERAAYINGYLNQGLGFVNWFGHGNPTYWDPWYNDYNIQLAFYPETLWRASLYQGEVVDVGDFNGDGRDDVVTFVRDAEVEPKKGNVYVSLSQGTSFGSPQLWHGDFAIGDEVPMVGDFNGDGKDDVVYFHRGETSDPEFGDVYVALSTGTSFEVKQQWQGYFSVRQETPRVGDVNGDGKDDIVTFIKSTQSGSARGDVYIALSDGSSFGAGAKWHDYFGLGGEVPDVGDFNGDGKDDISVFVRSVKPGDGAGDVYVSLSTGTNFGTATTWHNFFCLGNEYPGVGDFNGDGKQDVITFIQDTKSSPYDGGVYVALSNGATFGAGIYVIDGFASDGGVVCVGDFSGDGYDDIVAFEDVTAGEYADTYVAISSPTDNEDKLPVVFALSCSTAKFHTERDLYLDVDGKEWDGEGASKPAPHSLQTSIYDVESWPENMLVKHDVGAIGYVGAADAYEYGGENLDKYFFEAYHVGWKPPTLGYMWSRAMEEFVTNVVEPQGQTYFAFLHIHKVLLFGDPSLRVGGLPFKLVTIGSGLSEYLVNSQSNSKVSEWIYEELTAELTFTVESQMDRHGFCNITLPLELLHPLKVDPVLCDGEPVPSEMIQNQTHSIIYFTYTHSSHLITIRGENNPPTILIQNPTNGLTVQDGVTLSALVTDDYGIDNVVFSIREPDGGWGSAISSEYESIIPVNNAGDVWDHTLDTELLPDGKYLFVVEATDIHGNLAREKVEFSVRNWALLELLPSSSYYKAGRTMPIKFRIGIDDGSPTFVWNEELTILIKQDDVVLQTSTHGLTAIDYRIDSEGEHYITNFKTPKVAGEFAVEVWRGEHLIDEFTFSTGNSLQA